MSASAILVLFFVGIVAIGLVLLISRAKAMSRASVETCLLCDSESVEIREEGAYRCRECGYDTDMSDLPATASLVNQFRDLKNALTMLHEAREYTAGARGSATLDALGGSSAPKYQMLDEATKRITEAMSLVRELIGAHPELTKVPMPAERIGRLAAVDFIFDSVFVDRIIGARIGESLDELDDFILSVQILADALAKRIVSGRGPS